MPPDSYKVIYWFCIALSIGIEVFNIASKNLHGLTIAL